MPPPAKPLYHRKGDTLHSTARRGGTSTDLLIELNPSLAAAPDKLKIATELAVPAGVHIKAAADANTGRNFGSAVAGALLAASLYYARSALPFLTGGGEARRAREAAAAAAGARRQAEIANRFSSVMGGDREGKELGERDGVDEDEDEDDDEDEDGPGATAADYANFLRDGRFPSLRGFLSGSAADSDTSRPVYYTRQKKDD